MASNNAENIAIFNNIDLKSDRIRIGLIADTHIPRDTKAIPPHVHEAFKGVDLILHAGDIYIPEVLDELETMAPVIAARGNGDWDFPQDRRLGTHCIIRVAGLTLGLSHALHYWGILDSPLPEIIERQFGQPLDIVIVGDTHSAMIERHEGVLIINPGSPTLPVGQSGLGTVGILEIVRNKPTSSIIQLSDFSPPS